MYLYILGCNETYTENSGRIASPKWPSGTLSNTLCQFVISVPSSRTISVYARAFRVRSDANCSQAYLEVSTFKDIEFLKMKATVFKNRVLWLEC